MHKKLTLDNIIGGIHFFVSSIPNNRTMKLNLVSSILSTLAICGGYQNDHHLLITQITNPVEHAEGPMWDGRTNILYFVDLHQGNIHAYRYYTGELTHVHLNGNVTPVILSKHDPNFFYVGVNRSLVALEWDGYSNRLTNRRVLTTVSQDVPQTRFNEGKADSKGRLWCGTMAFDDPFGNVAPYQGRFYKITSENLESPTVVRDSVSISNGLAWNKANDKLYYIDTATLKVVEFDFNLDSGTISDYNRTVFDVATHPCLTGIPDGMTIDEDDNLWIALMQGSSIIQVNSKTGELLRVIRFPVRDVTSATWGGPNLDILYVTTSRLRLSEEEKRNSPTSGSIFAIENLNTRGVPAHGGGIIRYL